MVADDDDDRDIRIRKSADRPCEFALVGRGRVASLVGIAGEYDEVDVPLDRRVEGEIQTAREVSNPGVEARGRIEPTIGFHPDVRVGDV